MQEIKDKLEKIQFEVYITKDLSKILDEHFQSDRYRENIYMDYWSLTHLFSEYTTLSYEISNKLSDIEKSLTGLVNELFELERAN